MNYKREIYALAHLNLSTARPDNVPDAQITTSCCISHWAK